MQRTREQVSKEISPAALQVKSDQERLDRELDFVEAQQAELEDMLAPLERQAESMQVDCVQNHTDTERVMTYQAAGKVNLQLQTMADTIKDIIERINNNNHKANGDESPVRKFVIWGHSNRDRSMHLLRQTLWPVHHLE